MEDSERKSPPATGRRAPAPGGCQLVDAEILRAMIDLLAEMRTDLTEVRQEITGLRLLFRAK